MGTMLKKLRHNISVPDNSEKKKWPHPGILRTTHKHPLINVLIFVGDLANRHAVRKVAVHRFPRHSGAPSGEVLHPQVGDGSLIVSLTEADCAVVRFGATTFTHSTHTDRVTVLWSEGRKYVYCLKPNCHYK